MDVRLDGSALVLSLDHDGAWSCSFSTTSVRLLLTGRGAATQTGHNVLVIKDEELPGQIIFTTRIMSGDLYITPGFHFFALQCCTGELAERRMCDESNGKSAKS